MDEEKLKACIVVPYEYLKDGVKIMEEEGEYNSAFRKMLDVSDEYISANLTPIVIYDLSNNSLFCVVKELMGKKLH